MRSMATARRPPDDEDRSDYQTFFARAEGAVAAPTAPEIPIAEARMASPTTRKAPIAAQNPAAIIAERGPFGAGGIP